MNKQILKTLNRLCAETECMQQRVFELMLQSNNKPRDVYSAVIKAKNSLLDAIHAAEEVK